MSTQTNCKHDPDFEHTFGTMPPNSRNPADMTWHRGCYICEATAAGFARGIAAAAAKCRERADRHTEQASSIRMATNLYVAKQVEADACADDIDALLPASQEGELT